MFFFYHIQFQLDMIWKSTRQRSDSIKQTQYYIRMWQISNMNKTLHVSSWKNAVGLRTLCRSFSSWHLKINCWYVKVGGEYTVAMNKEDKNIFLFNTRIMNFVVNYITGFLFSVSSLWLKHSSCFVSALSSLDVKHGDY